MSIRQPRMLLAVAATCCALAGAARAQTTSSYKAPRLDGHPNLSGIWQALNTADWDLLTHDARIGPITALGAVGAVPPGIGIVEGDEIPYKPDALAKKKTNGEHWLTEDPEVKCYMPGVPRATYMPYPFQIVQGSSTILMAYEFAGASPRSCIWRSIASRRSTAGWDGPTATGKAIRWSST